MEGYTDIFVSLSLCKVHFCVSLSRHKNPWAVVTYPGCQDCTEFEVWLFISHLPHLRFSEREITQHSLVNFSSFLFLPFFFFSPSLWFCLFFTWKVVSGECFTPHIRKYIRRWCYIQKVLTRLSPYAKDC